MSYMVSTSNGTKATNGMKSLDYTYEEVRSAYRLVKANRGAAGIDQQTLEKFDENLHGNLYKVWNRLASGSYFPPPVKAVPIPKKSGGTRTLGIPTVCDRVAQTVIKCRLEPMVEPIFDQDSYGFRPRKSAHQALAVTRKRCWRYSYVVEFDIAKAFDNISHNLLMRALKHLGVDKGMLMYIERWLTAPMQHEDGTVEQRTKGTPQGGAISPLLANLFFHHAFDAWMRRTFPTLPFCRYADDALVHCHTFGEAERVLAALTSRLEECGLSIHPAKTSIVCCNANLARKTKAANRFTFLGYTFQLRCCLRENRKQSKYFTGFVPAISAQSEKSIRGKMKELGFHKKPTLSLQNIATRSRPYLQGWYNYFGRFYRSRLARVYHHFNALLVRWAMRKFKRFRGKRGKAQVWLGQLAKTRPNLFPHWKAGWTYMVG